MQRICRDSLADCTASRRRRQMVRLKSIKRILEDLQKQIRSLRAASNEELQRNIPSSSGASSSRGLSRPPSENRPPDRPIEDSDEEDLETSLGLEERNYDERVGEGNRMRSLAQRSLSMAIKRLSSDQPRRPPQPQQSLHRYVHIVQIFHN